MVTRVLTCILVLLACAVALRAQPMLQGKLEGNRYTSPTGEFSITVPVLPELGGTVNDTSNVVTFQDQFSLHASIACFAMDATQRWESETRGRREYLIWFFSNFVQSDFASRFPGAEIESAKYFNNFLGGSLLVFNLLPGGSMFEHRIALTAGEPPPVAKRGNLLFVHDGYVYVVSTELAEKVVQRTTFKMPVEDQDELLRKRLMDLVARMTFTAEETAEGAALQAPE